MMIGDLTQNLIKELNRALEGSRQTAEATFSGEQFKPIIESALKRSGLVTREEFDAQQVVLERTREKVEQLEVQVKLLEEAIVAQPTVSESENLQNRPD